MMYPLSLVRELHEVLAHLANPTTPTDVKENARKRAERMLEAWRSPTILPNDWETEK